MNKKKKRYFNWLTKKQKKPESGKPSGTMNSENVVSYLHQQQQGSPSNYTLHRSIKTLIYENFIQVITSGELAPLIISGQPPIDELVIAWDNIVAEYSESIKNNRSINVFECYKRIAKTEGQIAMINAGLLYLTHTYDEEIATIIHNLGYLLITPDEDHDVYLKMIERVRTESKTLVVLLNQYKNEYQLINPESKPDTREYQDYMNELAILSKYQGYALKPKDITVAEYSSIVNSFIAYNEAMKKMDKK